MTFEKKQEIYLNCLRSHLIRRIKTDKTAVNLLKNVEKRLEDLEFQKGVEEFEKVLLRRV